MNGHTENCGSCRFWRRNENGKPGGVCREGPPTVLLVGAREHPIAKGQTVPIVDSFWRPIPEE